jgi:hypothetical protein
VNSPQANPNKTKQNCLDFLDSIRPNQVFSMGYWQAKIASSPKPLASRNALLIGSAHVRKPEARWEE